MFKETITYLALYIRKVVCKTHLLIFLLSDTVFTLKNAHSLHLTFIFAHLWLNSIPPRVFLEEAAAVKPAFPSTPHLRKWTSGSLGSIQSRMK